MVIIQLTTEQLKSLIRTEFREVLKDQQPSEQQSDPDERKPLNVEEAAKILGVSKQTVYQNIDKLPKRKRFGRLYFFKSELLDYLNAGEGGNS